MVDGARAVSNVQFRVCKSGRVDDRSCDGQLPRERSVVGPYCAQSPASGRDIEQFDERMLDGLVDAFTDGARSIDRTADIRHPEKTACGAQSVNVPIHRSDEDAAARRDSGGAGDGSAGREAPDQRTRCRIHSIHFIVIAAEVYDSVHERC